MSRAPWAFLPAEAWQEPLGLAGDEARHLGAVLRLREGARVVLFDGQGRTMACAVRRLGRRGVMELEALAPATLHPRPAGLVLAPAWTKGGRRGFTVEKAVELGVQGLWFWRADRSQGAIPADAPNAWQRQAVAAAKQCRAPWLPELRALPDLASLLAAAQDVPRRLTLWEEAPAHALVDMAELTAPCLVAVGPEGGLTAAEAAEFAAHGWQARSLGPRVLRAETAGLYIAALAWYEHHRVQESARQVRLLAAHPPISEVPA